MAFFLLINGRDTLKNYGTLDFHFSKQRSLSNTDLNTNIMGAGAVQTSKRYYE